MMNKLKQQKGETLIETLVSMMIIVLTVAFLCTCVMSATNINKQTQDADKKYREELLAAESRSGTHEMRNVVVSFAGAGLGSQTVEVKVYGDADSDFISYDYEVSP